MDLVMQSIDSLAGKPVRHKGAVEHERWGKDHWSTYAYLGAIIVNHGGRPDLSRMRCDPDLHPGLHYSRLLGGSTRKYPTRLKRNEDGTPSLHEDHDDWSCVEDFESAGLVVWGGSGINPVFRFTDHGWKVWHLFEKHIADNPRKWSTTFFPDGDLFPDPAADPDLWADPA